MYQLKKAEIFCIICAIFMTLSQFGTAAPDASDLASGMKLILRTAKDQLQGRLPFGNSKNVDIIDELDDEMDVDEKRRKREINFAANILDDLDQMPMSQQIAEYVQRGKRSPCRGGTNSTAAPGGEVVDGTDGAAETESRKRGRNGKGGKGNARKARNKQQIVRRRRQADDNAGQKFNDDMQKFSEGIQNVWQAFMNSVKNVLEEVNKAVSANGTNKPATK